MTLEEIKDIVAKEKGWINWDELSILVPNHRESVYWPEVCRRAQLESGRLTLEKAAGRVEEYFLDSGLSSIRYEVSDNVKESLNIVIVK